MYLLLKYPNKIKTICYGHILLTQSRQYQNQNKVKSQIIIKKIIIIFRFIRIILSSIVVQIIMSPEPLKIES